jgi:hypothetical protein
MSCGAHGSLTSLYEKVSGRIAPKKQYHSPAAGIWRKWEHLGDIVSIALLAHSNLIKNPDLGDYLKRRKVDDFIKQGMLGYLDGYFTFPIMDEYQQIKGDRRTNAKKDKPNTWHLKAR